VGIVVTATLGAAVVARASQLASRGSVLDERSLEETVQYHKLRSQDEAKIAGDIELLGRFVEALELERTLEQDARSNRSERHDLLSQAQTQLAIARFLQRRFTVAASNVGQLYYPAQRDASAPECKNNIESACAMTALLARDHHYGTREEDPAAFHPDDETLAREGGRLEVRAAWLFGIAALLVGAIVLFTVAQIPRGTGRAVLAGSAAAILATAAVLFVLFGAVGS